MVCLGHGRSKDASTLRDKYWEHGRCAHLPAISVVMRVAAQQGQFFYMGFEFPTFEIFLGLTQQWRERDVVYFEVIRHWAKG
jgi:hypothetical protein